MIDHINANTQNLQDAIKELVKNARAAIDNKDNVIVVEDSNGMHAETFHTEIYNEENPEHSCIDKENLEKIGAAVIETDEIDPNIKYAKNIQGVLIYCEKIIE